MGIFSTIKTARTIAKTVKTAASMAIAGGTVVSEVNKGIKGAKASNRMEALEDYAFELMFEKNNGSYVNGARIYDAKKSVNLLVSASDNKGARCLKAINANDGSTLFTITESRGRYRWNGDHQSTDFTVAADGYQIGKLELKMGGTFWKYALPAKGLAATESSTGYKVVDSRKELLAETVGKFRTDNSVLVYVRDSTDFSLILAMLFTPVLFQGITTPENFSADYDKYVNKMQSKFGLF